MRRLLELILALVTAVPGSVVADEPPALPAGSVERIVIRKADHVLEAWGGDRLLKRYRVAIGSGGAGPKRAEGDGRTPEGTYRIDRRHASRAFHRFLHVSYPNPADRRAHRELVRSGAIARGTGIGGQIGIHGAPRGWAGRHHKLVDWTAGCVALDDDEIEELYRAVRPGAAVEILP